MSRTASKLESLEPRFRGLKSLVGNTPLLAVDFRYRGRQRVLYAKAEHINMTGSISNKHPVVAAARLVKKPFI